MNRIGRAQKELLQISELTSVNSAIRRQSPLLKLWVTAVFLITAVSFSKYDLPGLFFLILFPLFWYQVSGISLKTCFYRMRYILPLVCLIGLFNPFFDREILVRIGGVGISGGVISFLTLLLKGILCLSATFLLAATTPMDELCWALRKIHCPKLLTTLLLLTCRYLSVLMDEAEIMSEAYQLRAPGQKGIQFSAWGSFLGQMILRSSDRAQGIYEAMLLRGFDGEYYAPKAHKTLPVWPGILCSVLIIAVRVFRITDLLGSLFV